MSPKCGHTYFTTAAGRKLWTGIGTEVVCSCSYFYTGGWKVTVVRHGVVYIPDKLLQRSDRSDRRIYQNIAK